uniref:Uncharacterized protein n=1 Tax=viral metagenome TaxID=1070528 RepID=A0A6C0KA86_9ZZZZ
MSSKALKEKLDSLKKIWDAQSTTYINTKPSAELENNNTVNAQALSNLANTYGKFLTLDAQLTGVSNGVNVYLKSWDNKMDILKRSIGNSKQTLKNEINTNNASGRMKTDKYNYNSETYIQASFYILSISTITFFIYKQLKQ